MVKKGDTGYAVSDIQRRIKKLGFDNLDTDGVYGELTSGAIAKFQQDRGLLSTGAVDEETWQELVEASYGVGDRTLYLTSPLMRGDDVNTLQVWLRSLGFNPGSLDGIYGPSTEAALKEFQHNRGIKADGIASASTINAFLNLRGILERNAEVEMPQKEPAEGSLAKIKQLKILLDAGHGGSDTGAVGPGGLKESIVCEKIAIKLADLLKILGARVMQTRRAGSARTVTDRINLANVLAYPLLISIHMNHSKNIKAEGSSCYYFTKGKTTSAGGQELAETVQAELIQTLGMKDCRVHGRNFNILRQTKAVTVIVEPSFLTNPKAEEMLKDEEYLQKIAYAIFDGLKNYLKSPERFTKKPLSGKIQ